MDESLTSPGLGFLICKMGHDKAVKSFRGILFMKALEKHEVLSREALCHCWSYQKRGVGASP